MRLTVWVLGRELLAIDLGQPEEETPERANDLGSTGTEAVAAPLVGFIPTHRERGYED